MVAGMATKKYTVTLPEDLAEQIRREVGPGAFSAYVTEAVRRQWQNDRLGELVQWMEEEHGPVTSPEMEVAHEEFMDILRTFAKREESKRAAAAEIGAADVDAVADIDADQTDYPMAS